MTSSGPASRSAMPLPASPLSSYPHPRNPPTPSPLCAHPHPTRCPSVPRYSPTRLLRDVQYQPRVPSPPPSYEHDKGHVGRSRGWYGETAALSEVTWAAGGGRESGTDRGHVGRRWRA
eukprot:1024616-Rhodomonas_salina.1